MMVRLYSTVQSLTQQLVCRESFYVVWAYSQYLQIKDFQIPADIEVAPQFVAAALPQVLIAEWTLEQITREVIQYGREQGQGRRSLRQWGTLAQIANTLRDLEGEIYRRFVGAKKIHLELMRISHRQFVWQQQIVNWRWIIRYYKLSNTPAINTLSLQASALTIEHIYLIGMSYLGIFLRSPFAARSITVEIPGINKEHIDRFLRFMSLDLSKLRTRLHAEHALDQGFAYRYSSLREYPLIEISQNDLAEIACPIPTLLFWRITTGLYYTLKDQKGFSIAIGQSFQGYVGEVLHRRINNDAIRIHEEAEYVIGRHRKDTVDWIVQQGDEAMLFVECKTKRLTWASKADLADLAALEQDIRKLAGAVIQLYRTIVDYRADHYPQLRFVAGRRIYPMVVTLEDWYFFGHELPTRLEAAVKEVMATADLPINWLEEMPYSIVSVDEFETAAGIINTLGIHPFVSGKVRDPQHRHWSYGPFCNDQYPNEVRKLPPLFADQFETMFAGLLSAQNG